MVLFRELETLFDDLTIFTDKDHAVKLLQVTSFGTQYLLSSLTASLLASNEKAIQAFLSFVVDNSVDETAKICILETLAADNQLSAAAHRQGAFRVCGGLLRGDTASNSISPGLRLSALNLFSSYCRSREDEARAQWIIALWKSVEESLLPEDKILNAEHLATLTGLTYSTHSVAYVYCKKSPTPNVLLSEKGIVASMCAMLKSAFDYPRLIEALASTLTVVAMDNNANGFNVLLNQGIVSTIITHLLSISHHPYWRSSRHSLVNLLQNIARSDSGADDILSCYGDLEGLLMHLLKEVAVEFCDQNEWHTHDSFYPKSVFYILSRLSFHSRVAPAMTYVMDTLASSTCSDAWRFLIGYFMRVFRGAGVLVSQRVSDYLDSCLFSQEVMTLGETSLLSGLFASHPHLTDMFVSKGAVALIRNTIIRMPDESSSACWIWQCVLNCVEMTQHGLKAVFSSEIPLLLATAIERGHPTTVGNCCKLVTAMLKTENGANRLPTSAVVCSLASRLTMPAGNGFVHPFGESPITVAIKAAETLESITSKQPPSQVKSTLEEVAAYALERSVALLSQFRCTSESSAKSFESLCRALKKSEKYQALARMKVSQLLSATTDEDSIGEASWFVTKFTLAHMSTDDSSLLKQFGRLLADGKLAPFSELNAHTLLAMSTLNSSQVRDIVVKQANLNTLAQMLRSHADKPIYKVLLVVNFLRHAIVTSADEFFIESIVKLDFVSKLATILCDSKFHSPLSADIFISLLDNFVQRVIKIGEAKLVEVGKQIVRNDLIALAEAIIGPDVDGTMYASFYKLLGHLLACEGLRPAILTLVGKFTFSQMLQVLHTDEGLLWITSDLNIFSRVFSCLVVPDRPEVAPDSQVSNWAAMNKTEQSAVLQLLLQFSDIKSPQSSSSVNAMPAVMKLMQGYILSTSDMRHSLVHYGLRCLRMWLSRDDIESLPTSANDVSQFLVQVIKATYDVNKSNRFDEIVDIIKILTPHKTKHSEEVIDRVIGSMVKALQPTSTNLNLSRMAAQFLQKLCPYGDKSAVVERCAAVVCKHECVAATLERIKTADDRFRSLLGTISTLLGSLLQFQSGALMFKEAQGCAMVIAILRGEIHVSKHYWLILNCFLLFSSREDTDQLFDAGLLTVAEPVAVAGPSDSGFFMVLQILQLLCQRGSNLYRELIPSSPACQIMVEGLVEGWCPTEYISRTNVLLGYCARHGTTASKYIGSLIADLDTKDVRKSMQILNKIFQMSNSFFQPFFELLVEFGLPTKMFELFKCELSGEDKRDLQNIVALMVQFIPDSFAQFASRLAKSANAHIAEARVPDSHATILSHLAKYSSNARCMIAAQPLRIFEDSDSGSEKFSVTIVRSLIKLATSVNGLHVIVDRGGIDFICSSLSQSRTTDLKVAVLELLACIARVEIYRDSLRPIVEAVYEFVVLHFHMQPASVINIDDVAQEAQTSNNTTSLTTLPASATSVADQNSVKTFQWDVFLTHDWSDDELHRNNHSRVEKVNAELSSRGIKTWFDGVEMRGSINTKMAEGVGGSHVIVVFLTQNYILKASGLGPKGEDDNCFFEFDNASLERGRSNMIAVVMEPRCRDTSKWTVGLVKGKLGTKLYIDLSENEGHESYVEGISRLVREIENITGKVFTTAAATPSSIDSAQSPTATVAIAKARAVRARFADVAMSNNDVKIGVTALELLHRLSLSESNRAVLENISGGILPLLQFICTRHVKYRDTAALVLVNVFGPIADLKGSSVQVTEIYGTARELIKHVDFFSTMRSNLTTIAQHCCSHKEDYWKLEMSLACIRNAACCKEFREILVSSKVLSIILRVANDGLSALHPIETSHKIIVCDILVRCAQSESLRTALQAEGAGELLKILNESVRADASKEEDARLWFASKQASDVLAGLLDMSNASGEYLFRLSGILEKSNLSANDLAQMPMFQTFISHKHSSAQDFARLLHSLIVGNGWTCFLDVENLDRIDMLSLLVLGCDIFICILSNDVFSSPFWKEELLTAVQASLPIVLVVKDGARFPDRYGLLTDSFPSAELIAHVFCDHYECCRDVFKTRAIQHSNEYFRSFSANFMKKVEGHLEEVGKRPTSTSAKKDMVLKKRLAHLSRSDSNTIPVDPVASVLSQSLNYLDSNNNCDSLAPLKMPLATPKKDETLQDPVHQFGFVSSHYSQADPAAFTPSETTPMNSHNYLSQNSLASMVNSIATRVGNVEVLLNQFSLSTPPAHVGFYPSHNYFPPVSVHPQSMTMMQPYQYPAQTSPYHSHSYPHHMAQPTLVMPSHMMAGAAVTSPTHMHPSHPHTSPLIRQQEHQPAFASSNGLIEKLLCIKEALSLDPALSVVDTIAAANRMLGLPSQGSLLQQIDILRTTIGV